MKFVATTRVLPIALVLIVFLVFANSLLYDFVWDDYHYILNWPSIENPLQNMSSIFKGEMPLGQGTAYRPVRSIYMAFSYFLWGKQPLGYHLQAIFLHISITILLWGFLKQLNFNPLKAFSAALFFGLHPLQVQSVSWISGNFDVIAYLFFFLSLYLYLLHHQKPQSKLLTWSIIFAWLSFLSKEATLVLPVILFLFHYFNSTGKQFNWQQILIKQRFYWLGILLYVVLRITLMPPRDPFVHLVSPPTGSVYLSIILIFWYYRLMLWPNNLNVNQNLDSGLTSFYREDIGLLIPASKLMNAQLFLGSTLVLLTVFLIKKLKPIDPIPAFLLTASFVCLLPVLQLIPTNTLYLDLYSYLSLFFFSGFISWLVWHFARKLNARFNYLNTKFIGLIVTLIFASFLAVKTYNLNQVWATDLSLWTYVAQSTPHSAKANYNLGLANFRSGHPDQAIKYIEKAYYLKPDDPTIINGLLNAYLDQQMLNSFHDVTQTLWEKSPQKSEACLKINQLLTNHQLQAEFSRFTFCLNDQ